MIRVLKRQGRSIVVGPVRVLTASRVAEPASAEERKGAVTVARPSAGTLAVALVLAMSAGSGLLAAGPAVAAPHKKPAAHAPQAEAKTADAKKELSAKPTLVGTYGDWGAYEAQGPKSKICYALAQPKERTPASLKREQGYIFISTRPGEHVRNEVSVIMGLPLKEGSGDAKAEVGSSNFDLVTKGQNAWMRDAAQESQLIGVMKKHGRLVVKAPSSKGAVATDAYSLNGLGQALDRVAKDCS